MARAKGEERKTDIEEIKKSLQEFCKRTETQMGGPCVELVSKILVPLGHPVEEILKATDEESWDAIVIGSHGKGFLRQTFLGSVAASVLERTRKPVFIIPLPSEKTEMDWEQNLNGGGGIEKGEDNGKRCDRRGRPDGHGNRIPPVR
jgi:hypothetical protein